MARGTKDKRVFHLRGKWVRQQNVTDLHAARTATRHACKRPDDATKTLQTGFKEGVRDRM